tara:strand:- start:432 stop:1073 length:642 start_codon:yes stop_codon:yes gene_type:complete
MAEFGWAYVSCENDPEVADGPTGSLQFHSGSKILSGSSELIWLPDSNTLNMTGTFNLSGTINANQMNIEVTNKNVINLSASGDTKFGDTIDDVHQFTGSLRITGGVSLNYYKVTSSPYAVQATDYIIGISSSAYISITLPSASISQKGSLFIFKDEWCTFASGASGGRPASSLIAISASGADTIDGNGGYEIKDGNNAAISLYSNGVNGWWVF